MQEDPVAVSDLVGGDIQTHDLGSSEKGVQGHREDPGPEREGPDALSPGLPWSLQATSQTACWAHGYHMGLSSPHSPSSREHYGSDPFACTCRLLLPHWVE